ncbi:hypothetical protein SCUCBS95973_001980 [Sporothrix curviconia]|uniref:Uncharacterized protein n=1 Tax=Sporothrix curviconia TaxID=1260050 RepID=A0ABP0B3Y4_9PEZI
MPSASFDIDACDHQDFRGANQAEQRRTNHTLKWSRDRAPPCVDCYNDVEECMRAMTIDRYMRGVKLRGLPSRVDSSNFNKLNRVTNWTKPARRQHTTTDALAEVQTAKTMSPSFIVMTSTYTPSGRAPLPENSAPLNNSDLSDLDGPMRSLPLAAFVKEPSVRDMERMVNREYEIVDSNGSTATGRRARELLRQSPISSSAPATDGDFELV